MNAAVHIPCPGGCGCLVLEGKTDEGRLLTLDIKRATYCVLWLDSGPYPRLVRSAGYPVHVCRMTDKQGADHA